MPWVQNGFDTVWEDEIDYENRPDLAPPGTTWDPSEDPNASQFAGNWVSASDPNIESEAEIVPSAPAPSPSAPSPESAPSRGGGGQSFDLGPLLRPYPGEFNRPAPGAAFKQLSDLLGPAPTFKAPNRPEITPFSYDAYTPTTSADVLADQSFGFRKGIGEDALMKNRAAQGLLRTGGTLKDLLDYNQNFATQEFGNVDARRFRDYGANRENAFQNWNANKDTSLGLYDRDFDASRAEFEPQLFEWTQKGQMGQRAEERAFDESMREFMTDYDIWRSGQNDIFDRLKWSSDFGLDAATR